MDSGGFDPLLEEVRRLLIALGFREPEPVWLPDIEGLVDGRPRVHQIHIATLRGVHCIVCSKRHATVEDVRRVWRLGALFYERTGIRPRLLLAVETVDEDAFLEAEALGVAIYFCRRQQAPQIRG